MLAHLCMYFTKSYMRKKDNEESQTLYKKGIDEIHKHGLSKQLFGDFEKFQKEEENLMPA